MNADDGSDVTTLTDDNTDDREPDWSTNTSTPGDDDGNKNKHDSKKKHYDDNAKETLASFVYVKSTSKLSCVRGSIPLSTFPVMELRYRFEMI